MSLRVEILAQVTGGQDNRNLDPSGRGIPSSGPIPPLPPPDPRRPGDIPLGGEEGQASTDIDDLLGRSSRTIDVDEDAWNLWLLHL